VRCIDVGHQSIVPGLTALTRVTIVPRAHDECTTARSPTHSSYHILWPKASYLFGAASAKWNDVSMVSRLGRHDVLKCETQTTVIANLSFGGFQASMGLYNSPLSGGNRRGRHLHHNRVRGLLRETLALEAGERQTVFARALAFIRHIRQAPPE
jgi:hypothetical protein